MRNPIQPSPDRPIPLPDRILMDAWWADLRDETREVSGAVLRIVRAGGQDRSGGRAEGGAARG